MSDTPTWELIHAAPASMTDTLSELTPRQWAEPSLCAGWSIQVAAGHILAGAEQTPWHFMRRIAANGFRFNVTMERDARRSGALPPQEIIDRLRATTTTTTTNHPPAPVMAMLGEIVVPGEDIRRPLGIAGKADPEAVARCLDKYSKANVPVGGKKRIAGLNLVAEDLDWSLGSGPDVSGPGLSLVLAMVGRSAGLENLAGSGVAEMRGRMPAPA